MDREVIVFARERAAAGRRCSFVEFKQRRLERRMQAGLVKLRTVDEYLAEHRKTEDECSRGVVVPFTPRRDGEVEAGRTVEASDSGHAFEASVYESGGRDSCQVPAPKRAKGRARPGGISG